jgi:hypothetical protein
LASTSPASSSAAFLSSLCGAATQEAGEHSTGHYLLLRQGAGRHGWRLCMRKNSG